jgi:DNA-3-methyladenine glycosylase I
MIAFPMSLSYCRIVREGSLHAVHRAYHDLEYGFPLASDDALFERLVLEINQAGLSWETVLKKREGFRNAYANFELERVAMFDDEDRARLLNDASIIRNRLKVNAAIENAKRILELQREHGSFLNWLEAHHAHLHAEHGGFSLPSWVKLFKKTFVFTGGEIVNEFLMSTGFLPGAHDSDCEIHQRILELQPAWWRVKP